MIINRFDTQQKTLIIAEIGNNHEGDFAAAQEMVRKAVECGVDAVKFQTVIAKEFVNPTQTQRLAQMSKFELPQDQFAQLAALAKELGVLFISTPLDLPSADFLLDYVDAFKIASGDITFFPMIEQIAKSGKPVIMSTGGSTTEEIKRTADILSSKANADVGILHCVSHYPVPNEQINLRSIPYLQDQFPNYTIGFSDHTLGIDACVAAVALGAKIVEKHFTLDKHYSDFRDHQLSADPAEMKELVNRIRTVEPMLGKPEKIVQPCEVGMIDIMRRSVTIRHDLPQGHTITADDLVCMRPGNGIEPGQEANWVGKALAQAVNAGDLLNEKMVS
jgi:sialic acid synthase SpsE